MKKEKYILIIGASQGLGYELANNLNKQKKNLILCARNLKNIKIFNKTKTKTKNEIIKFKLDVSKENNIKKLVDFLNLKKISLNVIINCAAQIGEAGSITEIDSKKWDKCIKTNLYGFYYLSKYFIPLLIKNKNSLFINFSGGGGTSAQPYLDSYSASKAAIIRLTENLSLEFKKYNLCICAISPGGMNTKIFWDFANQGKLKLRSNLWNEVKKRKKNGGSDINKPINLINYLINERNRMIFNGRVISAIHDNWSDIKKNQYKINKTETFFLRRIDSTNKNFFK
tara:strand:+ start:206 stop:1057 length:852 start_codon:yes stop_codon:yes gene_type:complete